MKSYNLYAMASNKYNKTENQRSHSSPNLTVNDDANTIFVFENGTVLGSLMKSNKSNNKVNIMERTTPEMVINANKESNRHNNSIIHTQSNHSNNNNKNITISLHNNNNNNNNNNCNNNREISNIDSLELELAVESTALLGNTTTTTTSVVDCTLKSDQQTSESQEDYKLYEQDSDFLESSIYSELHFPPSSDNNTPDIGCVGGSMNDGFTSLQSMTTNRSVKRTKRKHRSKSKCNATAAALIRAQRDSNVCHPPRYTAIYVASTLDHQYDPTLQQIVNVAAHSPLLANQPVAANTTTYLPRPMYTALTASPTRARHQQQRSSCYRSSVSGNILTESTTFHAPSLPLPSSSSILINWNLRKWCTQPSLPFIIGLLALGGVACTLVGIVLGSTGLIGHSTQYLSAALLLIGIGVSLLVIAGAIWRLSLPDINECRCYQRMEMCRTCSSPFCENRILTTGYIYPEFQHRAPPPSYMTSLYGCTTNGINFVLQSTGIGVNTPPPVYQSTNSLRITSSSNPDMDHNNLVDSEISTNTNTLLNVLDTNQNENVITINSEIISADVTQLSEVKKDVRDLDLGQPSID